MVSIILYYLIILGLVFLFTGLLSVCLMQFYLSIGKPYWETTSWQKDVYKYYTVWGDIRCYFDDISLVSFIYVFSFVFLAIYYKTLRWEFKVSLLILILYSITFFVQLCLTRNKNKKIPKEEYLKSYSQRDEVWTKGKIAKHMLYYTKLNFMETLPIYLLLILDRYDVFQMILHLPLKVYIAIFVIITILLFCGAFNGIGRTLNFNLFRILALSILLPMDNIFCSIAIIFIFSMQPFYFINYSDEMTWINVIDDRKIKLLLKEKIKSKKEGNVGR